MNRWFIFHDDISNKDIFINIDKILYIAKGKDCCEIYDIENNVFSCSSIENMEDLFNMIYTINS